MFVGTAFAGPATTTGGTNVDLWNRAQARSREHGCCRHSNAGRTSGGARRSRHQSERGAEEHAARGSRRPARPSILSAERDSLSRRPDHRLRGDALVCRSEAESAERRSARAERNDDHRRHQSFASGREVPHPRTGGRRPGADGALVPGQRPAARHAEPRLPDAQHPGELVRRVRGLGRHQRDQPVPR